MIILGWVIRGLLEVHWGFMGGLFWTLWDFRVPLGQRRFIWGSRVPMGEQIFVLGLFIEYIDLALLDNNCIYFHFIYF